MSKKFIGTLAILALALIIGALLLYQVPAVNRRLSWRLDIALTYLRGVIYPAEAVPTPRAQADSKPQSTATLPPTAMPTATITPTPDPAETSLPTPTLSPSPTPIPERVILPSPRWEKQDWNNCGPATLSMYLNYYGWEGDQHSISTVLKPTRNDRNVNVEELAHYARNYAGWLTTQYRVNGDIDLLRELIAADIPVMIESSFFFDGAYWPNDDLWAAHYLLVTGYDTEADTFTVQNSFDGPDEILDTETLDSYWQPFNRVYMLIYLPEQEDTVKTILDSAWDEEQNRRQALAQAEAEIEADPDDAYAWFNLGTNLLYFERYEEAADAYDQARTIGLPQRMTRYQFGPFFAYFHTNRIDELLALTEYTLERTPNSEEALLWHGWALYRQGNILGAINEFRAALEVNPNNVDAQYALDFVSNK